jgi:probable F420-dependent oxidoreductase
VQLDVTLMSSLADTDARAAAAEDAGFTGAWVAETSHDPFLGLTLAARSTSRITLGTNIAVAFARSPMTVATTANDLQLLSGGRFVLGLGSQIKPHITRRFSMPWSSPAARMKEYVEALRAIWRSWHDGEPLRFEGEFYRHTLMTPAFSPGPSDVGAPPVYLAAIGERMTAVAAEVADGLLLHPFTTERYLREVTLPAVTRAGADLSSFELCGMPIVVTGRDEREMSEAEAGARAQISFYASTPAYRPILDLHGWGALGDEAHALSLRGEWEAMADLVDDEVLATIAVVAPAGELYDALESRFGDVLTRCAVPMHGDQLPPLTPP